MTKTAFDVGEDVHGGSVHLFFFLSQLLVEANSTITALQEELDSLNKKPLTSLLQDSNKRIQVIDQVF